MSHHVNILGINAYHGDVSAVLVRDGQLVAAVEEERFRRIKHVAGFPAAAIRACLEMGGIEGTDVHHVAVSRNPRANLLRKGLFALRHRPQTRLLTDRAANYRRVGEIPRRSSRRSGLRRVRPGRPCTGWSIIRLTSRARLRLAVRSCRGRGH